MSKCETFQKRKKSNWYIQWIEYKYEIFIPIKQWQPVYGEKNKECGDVYVSKCLLALILYLEQWCYNTRTKCIICLKGLVSSDRHWVQKQMTKGQRQKVSI